MYDWLLEEQKVDPTLELKPFKEMLRSDLWKLVHERKANTDYYEVDILIRSRGHEALRLPPYQVSVCTYAQLNHCGCNVNKNKLNSK
jgi:hypothetical protein